MRRIRRLACLLFCGLLLASGLVTIAGTFHATVSGVPASAGSGGAQADGQRHGLAAASLLRPYQLEDDARVLGMDRSYSKHGPIPTAVPGIFGALSASDVPWELLIAAWALLGAALLSRGAHMRPVS